MTLRALAILFALAFAAPSPAQEPAQERADAGKVRGTLDLEVLAWPVVVPPGDQSSGWHDDGTATSVRLVAAPEAADPPPRLTIRLTLANGAADSEVVDARVELDRDGAELLAAGQNVDLTVSSYERQGAEIALAGNLSAALSKGGDGLQRMAEPEATLDVSFRAIVPPAE